jgi:UDP-N-acetyl-D-galactosamine dehydrogenase
VGGHCIGVDPYYLTYKAESLGYNPQVILAGRRINDNMGVHIGSTVVKLMAKNKLPIYDAHVLVLGITFKENCPDIRNSKVVDVIRELKSFGTKVDVYDPQADPDEVQHEYGFSLIPELGKSYHAVVLAVAHDDFKNIDWSQLKAPGGVVYDVKGILDQKLVSHRL